MTKKVYRYLALLLVIFVLISICLSYIASRNEQRTLDGKHESMNNSIRGVVVTLIRSTNRSIALTINMIKSVVYFHQTNGSFIYPFLIFHDENFTELMRERIRSCVLKTNKNIQISFALVNFTTNITINPGSPSNKPIGYRLMCRFWTYDVFYHPTIIQGNYDYLMRMDDDSYFSNFIEKDLFLYMASQQLDYMYRSTYLEGFIPMEPILKQFVNKTRLDRRCIYNNFFVVRLKWFHESIRVHSFIDELLKDDLILREYIGDGCAHSAILEIDKQVKVEHFTDVSYGHNYHIMPKKRLQWSFNPVKGYNEEVDKACEQLTIITDIGGKLKIIIL